MYDDRDLESNCASLTFSISMPLQAYKSMMYAGGLLTVLSVVAVAVDAGLITVLLFGAGLLTLLAGAVGYLWNGE